MNDDKSWKEKGTKHIHEFKLQIGSQDKTFFWEKSQIKSTLRGKFTVAVNMNMTVFISMTF